MCSGAIKAEQPQFKTKLKGTENPLLNPEELNLQYVSLLMEMNVVPIIVWDFEGGLISGNDIYFEMLGYTREEFKKGGIDWASVTPPEYLSLDQRCVDELKRGATFCRPYVKEYIRKDGSRVAVKLWNARGSGKGAKNIAIILPISDF